MAVDVQTPPELITLCCPSLLTRSLSDADAESAASVFRALGDPARVKLLSLIAEAPVGGVCVCDLQASLALAQPTVSHHLKVLFAVGLVSKRRQGTWMYYRLRPESLEAVAGAFGPPAQPRSTGRKEARGSGPRWPGVPSTGP